ncbi:hypothetical protein [Pseudorhodoferax sp.]|uniref:hypothetical protein n=1 Tax=Pseudorhodoferax sp. TaxID=1993553 RepID=UPI002DD66164|nr:hypothetical protein [Pseudorhodoferax sp.]
MPDPRPAKPQTSPQEEPELRQEESVPSDGKDTKGEKMMEELGRDKPGRPLAPDPAAR